MNNLDKAVSDIESTLISLEGMLKDGDIVGGEAQRASNYIDKLKKMIAATGGLQAEYSEISHFSREKSFEAYNARRAKLNIIDVPRDATSLQAYRTHSINSARQLNLKFEVREPLKLHHISSSGGYTNMLQLLGNNQIIAELKFMLPDSIYGTLDVEFSTPTQIEEHKGLLYYVGKYVVELLKEYDIVGNNRTQVYRYLDQIMSSFKETMLEI